MGTPRNWYNKDYYPGGSSSGAGSAIGSGVIPFAVGTDAAGSLRVPAAFNGCYSIKPTFGRIEYKHASVCVTGPMAATVSDLTIAYRIMAQANPADPLGSQFAPSVPPVKGDGKRYIGVCRPWVATAVPFVLQTFNNTLNFLIKAGYEVIDIDLPYIQQGHRALNALCLSEASERAKARVENPAQWLNMANAANRIYLSVGAVAEAHDYVRWGMLREAIMQHLASLWKQYPGMLILTPTTPEVGWKAHAGDQKYGFSDGNCTTKNVSYCWLSNFSGCPSTQCPMGYGEPEQGEGRVPVGIMAMGEWGEEERLLGFAKDMERWLNEGHEGGRLRPKEWVDTLELAVNAGLSDAKAAEDSDGTKATSK
jgi:Asp-tRNA(Asn)/Glu-tRNA(Gln) amidotransferase A subunit family amidase